MTSKGNDDGSLQRFKIIRLYDDDKEHLLEIYYDKYDEKSISPLCQDAVVDSNRIKSSVEELTFEQLQDRHKWEEAMRFPHLLCEKCYLSAFHYIKKENEKK